MAGLGLLANTVLTTLKQGRKKKKKVVTFQVWSLAESYANAASMLHPAWANPSARPRQPDEKSITDGLGLM